MSRIAFFKTNHTWIGSLIKKLRIKEHITMSGDI